MIDVTQLPEYPAASEADLAAVEIEQKVLSVKLSSMTVEIYSQQTAPSGGSPKLTVLLLHGMSFTSQNWVDIKTLQNLALWGFRAVAIDLPGYGKSKNEALGPVSNEEFMAAVVSLLQIKPVIISPSMSGGFALPYLFEDPLQSTEKAIGYIPVAPVLTANWEQNYPKSQLPTLIVYGSRDERLGFASRDSLKVLPASQIAEIPDAGHACYMNQPALFHNLLYWFLNKLSA